MRSIGFMFGIFLGIAIILSIRFLLVPEKAYLMKIASILYGISLGGLGAMLGFLLDIKSKVY